MSQETGAYNIVPSVWLTKLLKITCMWHNKISLCLNKLYTAL